MTGRAERRGVSLSVKLILWIAVLLAVAVGAAAVFNFRTLTAVAEREAASRRRDGEQAMQAMSALLARNAAVSAALPLADGNFTYLDSLVAATVREDARLTWMLIADAGSNRVVARTPGAPAGQILDDKLDAAVLAAAPDRVVSARDPDNPTRFTFGMKVVAGERVVGQLRLGVSTAELEVELQRSVASARADALGVAEDTLVAAGVILGLGIVLAAWLGARMVRPLAALSRQAHRIAEGDLDQRVEIRGRDEIGRLGTDFNFMADRLGALLAETASKASLEREMLLARGVQESMNPTRHMQEVGPFRIVGSCEPATACGGDWWTLMRLGGDRLLVVVGDVTGHGIPSAIVAATARGAVEALAHTVDDRHLSPEIVLRAIHAAIRGVGTQQLLMTCFAAIVDPARGLVEYSNAGHNFPYLVATDPAGVGGDLGVLALRGSPLGNVPGEFVLESSQRQLAAGDVLLFFTDGVIDRVDASGNRFGDRRLRHMLVGRRLGRGGDGLPAVRDTILAEIASFARGAPADDDITVVLVQYDPPAAVGHTLREARA
jgi:sigma-B regulation protein RsbU (phosphoserine phosphatase)